MTKPSNTVNPPDLAERAGYLIELAARAPSVHNTQPWRFTVTGQAIELYADASRQLMEDLTGREMIISCGAALFGLRLAIRSLGYQPEVDLFPEPSQRHLLARVRAGRPAPMTSDERAMLRAAPHRHTHRGAFEPGPLPGDLLERLRDDAAAEGATLTVIDGGPAYERLTAILAAWSQWRDLYPTSPAEIRTRAETLRWTHPAGQRGQGRGAAPCLPGRDRRVRPGILPERDFDLGRGWGFSPSGGPPAPVTAILVADGEDEQSWLRAGEALQRLLLRAAEPVGLRRPGDPAAAIRVSPGADPRQPDADGLPQLPPELGVAQTSHPTARRPASEVTTDS